jgi:hypothetical protein
MDQLAGGIDGFARAYAAFKPDSREQEMIDSREQEMIDLKAHNKRLKERDENLKSQLQTLNDDKRAVEEEKQNKIAEISALQSSLEILGRSHTEVSSDKVIKEALLNDELLDLKNDLRLLNDTAKADKEKHTRLLADIEVFRNAQGEHAAEHSMLKRTHDLSKKELKEVRAKTEVLDTEYRALHAKHEGAIAELSKHTGLAAKHSGQIQAHVSEIGELTKAKEEISRQLDALKHHPPFELITGINVETIEDVLSGVPQSQRLSIISTVDTLLKANKTQFKHDIDLWDNVKIIRNEMDDFVRAYPGNTSRMNSIARRIKANKFYDQLKDHILYQNVKDALQRITQEDAKKPKGRVLSLFGRT